MVARRRRSTWPASRERRLQVFHLHGHSSKATPGQVVRVWLCLGEVNETRTVSGLLKLFLEQHTPPSQLPKRVAESPAEQYDSSSVTGFSQRVMALTAKKRITLLGFTDKASTTQQRLQSPRLQEFCSSTAKQTQPFQAQATFKCKCITKQQQQKHHV
jgi:hypothetical protein